MEIRLGDIHTIPSYTIQNFLYERPKIEKVLMEYCITDIPQ